MSKAGKLIIAVVIVAVVAGGVIWAMNKKDSDNKDTSTPGSSQSTTPSDENGEKDQTTGNTSSSTAGEAPAVTIIYNGSSFEPSSGTLKAGQIVKVVNQSSKQLDFDSDPHPVHTDNTELNTGDIAPGESKTFKITKKGTWGYHNHLNPSQHGSLTVE